MKKIILGMTAAMWLLACTNRQNPFLEEWDTPYGIPPFGEIHTEDFIPAIEAGIEQQNKEIEAIVANQEEPTFARPTVQTNWTLLWKRPSRC